MFFACNFSFQVLLVNNIDYSIYIFHRFMASQSLEPSNNELNKELCNSGKQTMAADQSEATAVNLDIFLTTR